MKPYAYDPQSGKMDVGCCPGHDWPPTRRWSGSYSSKHSKRAKRRAYVVTKRRRRHLDKTRLNNEAD